MSPSKNDNSIEDQVKEFEKQDSFGQMNISNWSCLVLDVADILAPMLGKKGMELYYRLSQAYEAKVTGWEGEEEAKFTAIMALYYVDLSLNEYVDINDKFGVVVKPPPYPPDEPWTDVDVEFYWTTGTDIVALPLEVFLRILPPEELWRIFPVYVQVWLVYQIQNHPEYGTRKIMVARISTRDERILTVIPDLRTKEPKDRVSVAQDIIDNKPVGFTYTRID